MRKVSIINGPNLNLLGRRQPEIYGSQTLEDIEAACSRLAAELELGVSFHQSNSEAEIIDWAQQAGIRGEGILINPAAYSHSSIAILDALSVFSVPVIEVHLSNTHQRESFRHISYVSRRADGVIMGCGLNGYLLGLRQLDHMLKDAKA